MADIQRLSHTMAKTQAVIDCINHLLQPTTEAKLLTSNFTSPRLIPNPNKTSHPQQSSASASPSSIRTPRVPPKPPNLITTHNPCPYGPTDNQSTANTPAQFIAVKASPRILATPLDPNAIPNHPTDTSNNNNISAQWPFAPCPATPAPPFILKPMIANMRHKPQPSSRFLTMLSRMAKNNYRPP